MTVDSGPGKRTPAPHTALQVEASSDTPAAAPAPPPTSAARKMGSNTVARSGSESLSSVLPKWWRLAKLWFVGEERWVARGYAVAVVGLALGTTLFSVHISYAQRDFSTALSGKDVPGFYAAVWKFAIIIVIAAPLFAFNNWVEEKLVLAWRAYLTTRLTRAYFANRAFYHIRQRADSTEALASPGPGPHTGGPGSGSPGSSAPGGGCSGGGSGGGPAGASSLSACLAGGGSGGGGGGGIDNPDQRICDDAAAFVRSSVSLSLTVCRKVFNCVAFAGVLWGVSAHLVVFLFGYATAGTLVTTWVFGRVMTTLCYRQLAREADLRFSLVRVRENAESIAFYRGESGERLRVLSRLAAVLGVTAERIRWAALYDLWLNVYGYATILVPSLLTAPRYFSGAIEFGVISQASFAFSRIDAALSVIINNLGALSGLAAETERLDSLVAAMEGRQAEAEAEGEADGGDPSAASALLLLSRAGGTDRIRRRRDPSVRGLGLQGLTLATPGGQLGGGRLLAEGVSLSLEPGQSLLIVGPSGCGKSSLLRAIAGLWTEGAGTVTLPAPGWGVQAEEQQAQGRDGPERGGSGGGSKGGASISGGGGGGGSSGGGGVFFLPQKAFMPLGDLRTQLTFPSGLQAPPEDPDPASSAPGPSDAESAPLLGSASAPSPAPAPSAPRPLRCPSDGALLGLLEDCCLPDLVSRVGGLDVELDWGSVLSVGEQQRVAVLRLLAAQPDVAFLDEATSALDGPTESRLYGLIRKRVPCFVSVGHRLALLQHHTHVLEALGGGAWRFGTAAEYQRRNAGAGGGHP
ncbi:hypothetical protein HYH03_014951 [Edaphochlamys debaryana]|uniref:ABC transporter n=1 Tax=Edaphochlamys debaryana TaxID=47281 RepID=A0A836BRG1_9CHLO|nr:hypothetical protein HYH03_014951 [Edaphochlamys debaryana]|eukprot:KAG2486371.1 hypothetical protein HYH03_014951 [Edaphochlamys debaryana]